MKKIYAIVMMALMALTVSAADADWYLYTWSDAQNAGGDAGQFVTTDTDGVFVMEGCQVTEEGMKFCLRNGDWSVMYGWSDEGGSVDAPDKSVKLEVATGATGWLALPVGTYDVTWNVNDLTITFTAASSTSVNADWFIYYWDDNANTGDELGQFKTTDNADIFLLENLELTNENGVKSCIHNTDWSNTYGWGWVEGTEGGSVTTTGTDVILEASNAASAWLGLPVGKYNVTWNAKTLTVRFDPATTTGLDVVRRLAVDTGVAYNLAGQRINANKKGIVIIDGKKYINR